MTLSVEAPRVKGFLIQLLMLISINVPTVSFGLAMGWVSMASGAGAGAGENDGALVVAAAATFAAGLLGVPLGELVLRRGRRPAGFATSAAFAVCWSLKLVGAGGWCVVAARAVAGAAGAAAWAVAPLYARETCSPQLRGAGAAAPVVAHNLGVLLVLLAADAGVTPPTVVAWCLALSAVHCAACWLAPESPAFLAARGDHQAAAVALARLRGTPAEHPALREELRTLPPADREGLPFYRLARDMLRDPRRRRAFIIALVCVAGQESCGVLSLLQFAERVFLLAGEGRAARHAVLLGAVQLVASIVALYLVERVGRRPLFIWGALGTGAALAVGAGAVRGAGGGVVGAGALAAAVAADSLALQPAPYAVGADMFTYQYRGCAILLITAAASAGGAAETLLFPFIAHVAGLWVALAVAAAATFSLAVFGLFLLPETRGKDPDQIYDIICPSKKGTDTDRHKVNPSSRVECGICQDATGAVGPIQNEVVRHKVDPNAPSQIQCGFYQADTGAVGPIQTDADRHKVDPNASSTVECGTCQVDAGGIGHSATNRNEEGGNIEQLTGAGHDNTAYVISCDCENEIDMKIPIQNKTVINDDSCAMCTNIASPEQNNKKTNNKNALSATNDEHSNEDADSNMSSDRRSSICNENDCYTITSDHIPKTTIVVKFTDVISINDVTKPSAVPVQTQTKDQCSVETQCTNL